MLCLLPQVCQPIRHMSRHEYIHDCEEMRILCPLCPEKFIDSSSLSVHIKTHILEKPQNCGERPKQFLQMRSLRSHTEMYSSVGLIQHSECLQSFHSNSFVQTDKQIHSLERSPSLTESLTDCKDVADLKDLVPVHVREYQHQRSQSFSSYSECLRNCAPVKDDVSFSLESSSKDLTTERQCKCEICAMQRLGIFSYKIYEGSNHSDKLHRCIECGKLFSKSTLLWDHMQSHVGEKPYECVVCHKEFSYFQGLQRHLQSHSGRKTYKCLVCCKKFRAAEALERHKKCHIGYTSRRENENDLTGCLGPCDAAEEIVPTNFHGEDRPYSCSVCQEKFKTSKKLMDHLYEHLTNNTF